MPGPFLGMAVALTLILPSLGSAEPSGVYVTEALIGYSATVNNTATAVTEKTLYSSQTGLGYPIAGWLYLGGVFIYTGVTEKSTDALSLETLHQETYQYYGPTLGLMTDDFFILGNYFVNAEKKDTITSPGALTQNVDNMGTGWGVNVGMKFPLWGFELAPTLAYKNILYTTCKDPYSGASVSCNPNVQQTEITPYVTFLFNFK